MSIPVTFIWESPPPPRQILTLPLKRGLTHIRNGCFLSKDGKTGFVRWSTIMKKLTADAKLDPAVPLLVLLTIFVILRMSL